MSRRKTLRAKIENVLLLFWIVLLPITFAINLGFMLMVEWNVLDIEFPYNGVIYSNICGALILIYLTGWLFNLVWSAINGIVEIIRLHKLNKYYKENPDKEKEMAEKLAKDFENLAQKLREDSKEKE